MVRDDGELAAVFNARGLWAAVGLVACIFGSVTIAVKFGGDALFRAWLLALSYSCITRWLFESGEKNS